MSDSDIDFGSTPDSEEAPLDRNNSDSDGSESGSGSGSDSESNSSSSDSDSDNDSDSSDSDVHGNSTSGSGPPPPPPPPPAGASPSSFTFVPPGASVTVLSAHGWQLMRRSLAFPCPLFPGNLSPLMLAIGDTAPPAATTSSTPEAPSPPTQEADDAGRYVFSFASATTRRVLGVFQWHTDTRVCILVPKSEDAHLLSYLRTFQLQACQTFLPSLRRRPS